MEKTKSQKVLLIITIITLITLIGGATYAYFQAQEGTGASSNIKIEAGTTDSLMFEVSDDINLNANQETFGEGKGNLTSIATAKATLKANNNTNNATNNYYVYLHIIENTLEYTQNEETAELLLKITGPDGEVTSLKGLERKTSGGVTGFDITMYDDTIKIADNYPITVDNNITLTNVQEWKIEIIFVNLDSNQNNNTNKLFKAKIEIQKEKMSTLADHIISSAELADNVYFHDSNNSEYAEDNSYRYVGTTTTTIYKIADNIYDYDTVYHSEENSNGIIKFYCSAGKSHSYVGQTCPSNLMTCTPGGSCTNVNTTEYYYLSYDETKTYNTKESAAEQAVLDGYLTSQKQGNYLCFGMEEECDDAHLYRIVGLFDDNNDNLYNIKIQKENDITIDYNSGQPSWEYINNYLNTTYLRTLGNNSTMIKKIKWNIGGVENTLATAKELLNSEKKVQSSPNKIGLISASDYQYATLENKGNTSSTVVKNWLGSGPYYFLTITPFIGDTNKNVIYRLGGGLSTGFGKVSPTFYLKSNVKFTKGTGTQTDPYFVT